jgi:preprotein translocase subunit SecG
MQNEKEKSVLMKGKEKITALLKNEKFKTVLTILLAVLFVLLIVLLLVLSFREKDRDFDKEEVESATRELLKEAEFLNQIYYGSGIKYYDTDEGTTGYYRKADILHLEELGFSTLDELKTITEKTFSDEYSALLYDTILSSLKEGSTVVTAARYYQAYDEETNQPTDIMVYSKFNIKFKDKIEYDYDSIKAERSKKDKVYVSVNATVTNSEGKSQQITLTITLIEEDDGWKIDNPTYANYNSSKDRYDELNKELK